MCKSTQEEIQTLKNENSKMREDNKLFEKKVAELEAEISNLKIKLPSQDYSKILPQESIPKDRHQNTNIEGETAGVVAGEEGEGVTQEHGPLRSRLKRMRVSKDVGERRKKKNCRGHTRKQEEKEKSGNRKCECRSSRCRKDHESQSDDDDSPAKRS
ncbi:hypothetical protein JTB14_005846 [Gonioctena quinquepunctata]|nr:hypothetical protein JTB14_005846 [Gonioctena quinquepunctata]